MRKVVALGGAMLVAVTFSACGGSEDSKRGEDDKSTASSTSTSTTAPEPAQRPEGDWSVMRWEIETGDEDASGEVSQVLYKITPTCEAGPCDLEITGAGQNGSAFPAEMPSRDGSTSGSTPMKGFTMAWDEDGGTYGYTTTENQQCFAADGAVVDQGFEVKMTAVLEFTAETGSAPAALHGTRDFVGTPTPEGAAAGCAAFATKSLVAAAPVGAFAENPPSLTGEYVMALWLEESLPPSDDKAKGTQVTFDDAVTMSGDSNKYSIKSWFDVPAELSPSGDGIWSGSATTITETCSDSGSGGEYDSTQEWENLQVVALTESGAPIISTGYAWVAEPNPAGVAIGCEKSAESGYAFLLPRDAV